MLKSRCISRGSSTIDRICRAGLLFLDGVCRAWIISRLPMPTSWCLRPCRDSIRLWAGFYARLTAGQVDFAEVARFKRYPTWGGFPSPRRSETLFIGYDHPAVLVFSREGDIRRRWRGRTGLNRGHALPDAALKEIAGLLAGGREAAANERRPSDIHWYLPH